MMEQRCQMLRQMRLSKSDREREVRFRSDCNSLFRLRSEKMRQDIQHSFIYTVCLSDGSTDER